jgi:hypothetical protein
MKKRTATNVFYAFVIALLTAAIVATAVYIWKASDETTVKGSQSGYVGQNGLIEGGTTDDSGDQSGTTNNSGNQGGNQGGNQSGNNNGNQSGNQGGNNNGDQSDNDDKLEKFTIIVLNDDSTVYSVTEYSCTGCETWKDWVNSEYNTDGYYLSGSYIKRRVSTSYNVTFMNEYRTAYYYADDEIVESVTAAESLVAEGEPFITL